MPELLGPIGIDDGCVGRSEQGAILAETPQCVRTAVQVTVCRLTVDVNAANAVYGMAVIQELADS